ncbi:MAG TPA: prepilin-type N-terminal cleavage/methylation domain-containing protein [Symbiobacteriaceae bacterium]
MRKWMQQVKKLLGRKTADQRGFTLIELAVALAILGILIAIAVPTYLNVRNRSYDSEAKQILGEIRSMAWSYYLENDTFPPTLEALEYNVSGDAADRWDFSLTGGSTEATIRADGRHRTTDGRCWVITLKEDGTATLTGPDC